MATVVVEGVATVVFTNDGCRFRGIVAKHVLAAPLVRMRRVVDVPVDVLPSTVVQTSRRVSCGRSPRNTFANSGVAWMNGSRGTTGAIVVVVGAFFTTVVVAASPWKPWLPRRPVMLPLVAALSQSCSKRTSNGIVKARVRRLSEAFE